MTSWAVNGLPSCQTTSGRSLNCQTVESSFGSHSVRQPGSEFELVVGPDEQVVDVQEARGVDEG